MPPKPSLAASHPSLMGRFSPLYLLKHGATEWTVLQKQMKLINQILASLNQPGTNHPFTFISLLLCTLSSLASAVPAQVRLSLSTSSGS